MPQTLQSPGGGVYNLDAMIKIMKSKFFSFFSIAAVLTFLLANASIAEAALRKARGDPFASPLLESSFPTYSVLYLVVGLAGVCMVGFKNSGRTHLD